MVQVTHWEAAPRGRAAGGATRGEEMRRAGRWTLPVPIRFYPQGPSAAASSRRLSKSLRKQRDFDGLTLLADKGSTPGLAAVISLD